MNKNANFLERNRLVYEFLLKKISKRWLVDQREVVLRKISDLAFFAWYNHCGFFADGRIENIVLEIGTTIESPRNSAVSSIALTGKQHRAHGTRRNLFIATRVHRVGGHTRVVADLIRRNSLDAHTLLLTEQLESIPGELARLADSGQVDIICLKNHHSLTDKALIVREMSMRFDRVLLFTHPHDVVPVLAFAVKSTPPVIVENHAHFFFWIGTSVADIVLSHIPYMNELTKQRRPVTKTFLFPMVPVDDRVGGFEEITKAAAKRRIGLDKDCLCILTVATREKFFPNEAYNLFSTARKIVERYSHVWILVVGLNPDEAIVKKYLGEAPERMRFLGIVEAPFIYYRAADIFMESFPLSSLGSVQESIYYGDACPLYAYGTNRGLLSSRLSYNEGALGSIIPETNTEAEYLEYLDELIKNPALRFKIVEHLKEQIIRIWQSHDDYRTRLFEQVDDVDHNPHTICNGAAEFQADDISIAGLSRYKTVGEIMAYFRRSSFQLSTFDMLKITFLLIRKSVFVQEATMFLARGALNRLRVLFEHVGKRERSII